MDAVGAGQERDIGAIVDDDADRCAAGDCATSDLDEAASAVEERLIVQVLLAQLDSIGAARDRPLGDGLPIESARIAVNNVLCDELATTDEALDGKSGTDDWVYNDDQTAVVDVNFIGAKQNYHEENCSFL